jgi:hypothetical protein
MTPIGTITHELGHVITARLLGYSTVLKYSSMNWTNDFKKDIIKRYNIYQYEIENNLPFDKSEKYRIDIKKLNDDDLLILLGGVIQTISFGLIAFFILINRKKRKIISYKLFDWTLIFITLFLLRETFNLLSGVLKGLSNNNRFFYGDEARIAEILNLHRGIFLLPLGILSTLIMAYVFFKIIPLEKRTAFIISGIIGIPIGYFVWMYVFGPYLLPK